MKVGGFHPSSFIHFWNSITRVIEIVSAICFWGLCVPELDIPVTVLRVEPIICIGSHMRLLNQWFSSLSASDPALWLALAAGLAVVLVFLLLGRGRRGGALVLPTGAAGWHDWENPPTARHDERRRSIRRAGLPTPILVVDAKGGKRARSSEAYVLDRSTGGLRLALERPVPVGTNLLAKPGNAPEGFQWVKLTIRNCREVGDYFEVGCQFESDLELSRLLMFG
jgi:hypothetical protein